MKTSKASGSIKRWWCEGGLKKVEETGAELSAGNNLKGRKSAARVIDKQEQPGPLVCLSDPTGMIISRRSIKLVN